MAVTSEKLRESRSKIEALLDAHPVGDPLHDKYMKAYLSIGDKINKRSAEELEETVARHKAEEEARLERIRLKKEGVKAQTVARKTRGPNRFQRPVIITPPSRHYARRDDVIRNQLEAVQEQQQRGRLEMERATRPPREVPIQTEARRRGRPRKSERVYNLGRIDTLRNKKDRGGSLSGGVAKLTELGGLPEYKPPSFKLDKSGYTPLDYKPLETKPMFQYTGFKTMDYKPISTEPFYKPSGAGSQPYYRPLNYQPIGQFGSVIGNPPNISGLQRSSEAEPKKRRKKSKEPRMVGG